MRLGLGLSVTTPAGSTAAAEVAPLDEVYGADLAHWWFEGYAGGTWTDDVGSSDMLQPSAGERAVATTSPGGTLALQFDGDDDNLGADDVGTLPAVGTRAAQYAFNTLLPAVGTGGYLIISNQLFALSYFEDDLYVGFNGHPASLVATLPTGWYSIVIDFRGQAALAANQLVRVYVNGIVTYSGAPPADMPTLMMGEPPLTECSHEAGGAISSLAVAHRATNFTLDTTALAASAALADLL